MKCFFKATAKEIISSSPFQKALKRVLPFVVISSAVACTGCAKHHAAPPNAQSLIDLSGDEKQWVMQQAEVITEGTPTIVVSSRDFLELMTSVQYVINSQRKQERPLSKEELEENATALFEDGLKKMSKEHINNAPAFLEKVEDTNGCHLLALAAILELEERGSEPITYAISTNQQGPYSIISLPSGRVGSVSVFDATLFDNILNLPGLQSALGFSPETIHEFILLHEAGHAGSTMFVEQEVKKIILDSKKFTVSSPPTEEYLQAKQKQITAFINGEESKADHGAIKALHQLPDHMRNEDTKEKLSYELALLRTAGTVFQGDPAHATQKAVSEFYGTIVPSAATSPFHDLSEKEILQAYKDVSVLFEGNLEIGRTDGREAILRTFVEKGEAANPHALTLAKAAIDAMDHFRQAVGKPWPPTPEPPRPEASPILGVRTTPYAPTK